MSDPVVVAMGDEKLKDMDGTEEKPEELAEAATHPQEKEDTDAPSTPTKINASPLLEPDLSSHPADELHRPDSPTTSLITSLRSQLAALSEQSHQLNTKLVASISRHADLEDQHYNLQNEHTQLKGKNEELTKAKESWENKMNTGLYVEQSQIRDEMQRLAAGLVEEERKRGSAEQRRQDVENEVDELATSLFEQANGMVANERMGRLEAEERLKSTEENLAAAESAVRDMQLHLQSLSTAPPQQSSSAETTIPRRFLSSHVPYIEYIAFIHHLRSLRPLREASKAAFPAPLVTNLLTQPFLARAVAEDHDPTLRFDAAPDLSWLSRRGVTSAIVCGELVIEPVSSSTILANTTTPPADIGCSLCGKAVFPTLVPQSPAASHFGPPPLHPTQKNSASRFSLKPFFNSTSTSPGPAPPSPSQSPLASPNPVSAGPISATLPSVYIFRIAKSSTAPADKESQSKSYPLCRSGWCLERLRATCALWHFIRTGLVQVVWTGDDGYLLQAEQPEEIDLTEEKPPLPPRKRSGWGLGFNKGPAPAPGIERGSSWKGWGSRSGTTSPPPGLGRKGSEAGSIGAEKMSDEPLSTELDAPIELEQGDRKGKGKEVDIPVIQAIDSSPTTTKEGNETPKPTEELLQPETNELRRADSTLSAGSTNRSEQFTTPISEHVDLPEEGDTPGIAESKTEDQDQDEKAKEDGEKPIVLSPPPVPRRAAARQKVGESVDFSRAATPPDTPTTASVVGDVVVEDEVKTEDEVKAEDEIKTEEENKNEGTEARPEAPPLPARHPQTPKQNRQSRVEEKTYLEDDEWEAKTWRMIIKLKEDMWKTRVGVVDGEDD